MLSRSEVSTKERVVKIPENDTREAKYAKKHFQQNLYSVVESHVMRKESLSTKILR